MGEVDTYDKRYKLKGENWCGKLYKDRGILIQAFKILMKCAWEKCIYRKTMILGNMKFIGTNNF